MVILILERVPSSLRGELSRWMIEPRAGVFVGVMSALVRDKLWSKVTESAKDEGAAVLIQSARTEQGFFVRTHGDPTRQQVEMEGLSLVKLRGNRKRGSARRRAPPAGEESEASEEVAGEEREQ